MLPHTASFEEMFNLYNNLKEEYQKEQIEWLKRLSAIKILHIINAIIIVITLILGCLYAKDNSQETAERLLYIAEFIAFAFCGTFVFSILWKIVFFFIRLSIKSALSKLEKLLKDMFLIKHSTISQIDLKPNIVEKDPHLANLFANKKNKLLEVEYDLYQCQNQYLKMQLKAMRSAEWQWIKYSFMFVVGMVATFIAIALFIVVILLILVWAYISSNNHRSYRTYETETGSSNYFSDKPSKHAILLESIEELKAYVISQQNYGEKLKESLHKWGAPDLLLFKNEIPLITLD